jgi:hypothetical protein
LPPHQRCCIKDDATLAAASLRGKPHEAVHSLADLLRRTGVGPRPEPRAIRAEHEESRVTLRHELEERSDRVRAADAQALNPNGEGLSEGSGLAELAL